MASYVIHDAQGNIIRVGNCPDGEEKNQKLAGNEMVLVNVQAQAHDAIDTKTKTVIVRPLPVIPPPPQPDPAVATAQIKALIYQVLAEIKAAGA